MLYQRLRVLLRDQHRIEHAGEGFEAPFALPLLEQRPAVLVEALIVEARSGSELDDRFVGALGRGIALVREQDLAAAELRLVDVMAFRITRNQPVESRERLVRLRVELVGARELIQHGVVALVIGIGFEQGGIKMNGLRRPQALVRRQLVLDALGLGAFQVQIAQSAHRLLAKRRITGVQVEEAFVAVHGLGVVHALGGVGTDVDLLAVEILDGLRLLLGVRMPRGGESDAREDADDERGRDPVHGCTFDGSLCGLPPPGLSFGFAVLS